MLEFNDLEVSVYNLDYLVVSWSIKPTTETISDYRFSVWRSNNPDGDFRQIVDDLDSVFVYKDADVKLKSKWRKYYYKVKITAVPPAVLDPHFSDEIGPESNDKEPDAIAVEIVRRNELLLKNFVGVPTNVFIRRTWGQRCPECWDVIKNRKLKSQCSVCYNTGFVGGFHTPVETQVNFNPSPEMIRSASFEMQPDQTAGWCSNYPPLSPRDIIVEDGRKRWRVVNVSKTEKLRTMVHQVLQLVRINQNDIEYKMYMPGTE